MWKIDPCELQKKKTFSTMTYAKNEKLDRRVDDRVPEGVGSIF